MKPLLVFTALSIFSVVFTLASHGTEASSPMEARVPGEISDGSPSPVKIQVKKRLQDFQIHWSQIKYVNGQKFTINRVEPPVIPAKKKLTAEERAKNDREYQELLKTMKPAG